MGIRLGRGTKYNRRCRGIIIGGVKGVIILNSINRTGAKI